MTIFEELASELGVPVMTDDFGLYIGITKALADICTETLFEIGKQSGADFTWDEFKQTARDKFFSVFPYMQK